MKYHAMIRFNHMHIDMTRDVTCHLGEKKANPPLMKIMYSMQEKGQSEATGLVFSFALRDIDWVKGNQGGTSLRCFGGGVCIVEVAGPVIQGVAVVTSFLFA